MKLFDFMKKRKVEEKPQSDAKMKTENTSHNQNTTPIENAPRTFELYYDDSDIGYC